LNLIDEIRIPILGNHVTIVSTRRRLRPKERKESVDKCPFCPGNEELTPPATLALVRIGNRFEFCRESRSGECSPWIVRIIPNKYPALDPNPPTPTARNALKARGFHEVVVESCKHVHDPHELSDEEYALSLYTTMTRMRDLLSIEWIKYVALIKNRGLGAGASIRHSHSQIFASPYVPPRVAEEVKQLIDLGTCPLCSYVEDEYLRNRYLVYESKSFALLVNDAPRASYEVLIVPKKHESRPSPNLEILRELAHVMRIVTKFFVEVLRTESYNMWFHVAPKGVEDFHWHIEAMPRLGIWGGYELSSDVYIVEVSPEEVAEKMRSFVSSLEREAVDSSEPL